MAQDFNNKQFSGSARSHEPKLVGEIVKDMLLSDSPFGKAYRRHQQRSGMAMYDDGDKFLFTPDNPVERSIASWRRAGVAQLLSDGTFDFIVQPRLRPQSELIRKLAHGRISHTKDGAVQLTLKVYRNENVNISKTIGEEAQTASLAVAEWLLRGGKR